MRKGKPLRLPGAQAKCRDCGAEFAGGRFAQYCPTCRPLHRNPKRTKYVLDGETIALLKDRYDGRIRNRAAEIARQLGWPKYAVQRAARLLGLVVPLRATLRKSWTEDEISFLRSWAGQRNAGWIARRLGRPESSVHNKIKRLELSRAVSSGYSLREVCRCFGVDHHVVDRWIKNGWLRHGNRHEGDRWPRFDEGDLRQFVRKHPLEFRLDKVDQVWFMGLVLGTPADERAERGCARPIVGKETFNAAAGTDRAPSADDRRWSAA